MHISKDDPRIPLAIVATTVVGGAAWYIKTEWQERKKQKAIILESEKTINQIRKETSEMVIKNEEVTQLMRDARVRLEARLDDPTADHLKAIQNFRTDWAFIKIVNSNR